MKKRTLILLMIFYTGICALLFEIFYREAKLNTISNLNKEQMVLAGQAAQGIEDFFTTWTGILTALSKMEEIAELDTIGKQYMYLFFDAHQDQISAIARMNEKGKISHTYPSSISVGADISGQAHVQKLLRNHSVVISDVFGSVEGFDAIAIHVPVFKGTEFRGSIAVLINFRELARRYLDNIRIGETGSSWVISRDGTILYSQIPGFTGQHALEVFRHYPSLFEMVKQMLQDKEGTTEYTFDRIREKRVGNIKKYAVYLPIHIGDTYWSIAVSSAEQDVMSNLSSFRNKLGLIMGFLFLGGMALLVALLVQALNNITKRKETEETLRNYRDYLQVMVDQRTTELTGANEMLKQEIDEHRKAEEERQRSEEKFRLSFMNSVDGCYIATLNDGKIIEINDAFVEVFGYSREETIGKTSTELMLYADPADRARLVAGLRENGQVREMEFAGLKKGGVPIMISLSGSMMNMNNEPYILGIVRDITTQKRSESELVKAKEKAEESDRLKSAFLANMSHEIRTPMNGILGFAELLKEPELTGEEQHKYIEIIEKSGARMLTIIHDIIDISKIESGQMDICLLTININTKIDYLYHFFLPEVQAKRTKLELKTEVPEKAAIINTDSEKINSILTNLIKNAIKFTSTGTIVFGYRKKADYLKFFVKDTGMGIDKDRQEAIFERFIQADIYDKQAYQGAGLGLSISKAYVEMLGGKIWVESEPGQGSSFYFTIPCNPRES
jgi:PAS domain S-box-containing protein